jgi:dihydroorotase
MEAKSRFLIKNAQLINEGKIITADVLIQNQRIEKIATKINLSTSISVQEIDATGMYLIPGVIDDQVHFREPGLTHKASIFTESRAALAGGVTSYMEMPNVLPKTTTIELLEEKYLIGQDSSAVNYSFYLGATNDNIDELKKIDSENVCGVKIFMGSSTGDMLVDDSHILHQIFSQVPSLIATHCECETRVKERLNQAKIDFPKGIPAEYHPIIRDAQACYLSSSFASALAKKYNTRLHILHITSEIETHLFDNTLPLDKKRITSEVCVHHLHFSDQDYSPLSHQIKCNPAVKSQKDQDALWNALLDDRLDVIATDHAPHTKEEKLCENYLDAHAGLPLIQHTLLLMLEKSKQGKISMEKVVEKMCHAPAIAYKLKERGFIREGYFADLVLVNPNEIHQVTENNILYKCQWSPLMNTQFSNSIKHVFVNGTLSYSNGQILELNPMRLQFEKDR